MEKFVFSLSHKISDASLDATGNQELKKIGTIETFPRTGRNVTRAHSPSKVSYGSRQAPVRIRDPPGTLVPIPAVPFTVTPSLVGLLGFRCCVALLFVELLC
jgi:hypothetical protein